MNLLSYAHYYDVLVCLKVTMPLFIHTFDVVKHDCILNIGNLYFKEQY